VIEMTLDRERQQIVGELARSISLVEGATGENGIPQLGTMVPGASPGAVAECMTHVAGYALRYIGQADPEAFLGDLGGPSLDLLRMALRRPLDDNVEAVRGLVARVKVGDTHGMGEIAVLSIVAAYQARRSVDVP